MNAPRAVASASEDRHHSRVRWFDYVAMVLTVLSLPVFLVWLYYRTVACAADISQGWCEWSFVGPGAFGAAVILSFIGILWTLSNYERDAGELAAASRPSTRNPKRFAHDTRRGYRRLHTPHRKHVRRQLFFSAIFLGEVAGFWTFYFGAPAMASMIVGVAVILIVVAFNTWLRLSEQREAA